MAEIVRTEIPQHMIELRIFGQIEFRPCDGPYRSADGGQFADTESLQVRKGDYVKFESGAIFDLAHHYGPATGQWRAPYGSRTVPAPPTQPRSNRRVG